MKTDTYIVMKPRKAESKVATSLVKDSGGTIVGKNALGLVVQCKAWVARQLDLIPLVHVEEIKV